MMLGHIIRQELNELENEKMRCAGLARRCSCAIPLHVPVAGYIAVGVAGHGDGARSPGTLQRAHGFYLNQDDVAAFLSRVGLDAERMVDVFPSAQDAAMLPP